MGIFYKEKSTYTIRYGSKQFNDLNSILENVIHYFYDYGNSWKYINNEEDIKKHFEDEEFGDFVDDRQVFNDEQNHLLSIEGIYIREHGEGTHLEINEDYLFEKLFNYDKNIIIIKDYLYETDCDINACEKSRELFYMHNEKIDSIYIEQDIAIGDFDSLINSSNLNLFIHRTLDNINIEEEIKKIYPQNIIKFYHKYKEKLSEENIIDLVKLDFFLVDYLESNLVDKIKKDKSILIEAVKSIDFLEIEHLEEDFIDIIVNDKDIVISFLSNNRGYWNIEKLNFAETLNISEDIEYCKSLQNEYPFDYKVLKKYNTDKEVMLLLLMNFDYSYIDLNDKLKCDKSILLEIFKNKEWVLEYASDDLRDDEELLNELMKINKNAYKYASKRLYKKYKQLKKTKNSKKDIYNNDDNYSNGFVQMSLF